MDDILNKKISIIISIYSIKRYDNIVDLSQNINIQTYNDIETIIIVDENIELYNKIENLLSNNKNVKIIFNHENRGLSYSRNIGIMNSTGDIVAFIDDDAIPDPRWAEVIANTFNNDDIGAVTGDIIPVWEYEYMSWFPIELHWMISCSYIMTPRHICEIERGFGTNMAFRRDLINDIGMFDINMGIKGRTWIGGEDSDMFLNVRDIGKKILFIPDAKVFHKIYSYRTNLKNIIKRAFSGGMSVAIMKRSRKKKLKNYDIKNSTENRYLKTLIFYFYPSKFKELIKRPCILPLKQMLTVFIVILTEGIGYLYGLYFYDI